MKQMMKMMALGASVSALAALVGCSQAGPMATAGEFEIEGKVYGMPKAEVFREDYRGDAVVGDTMTASPHLAKLDYAGNKTHQVRLDTLSQKVEVAPGVSYTAWTFGGSVPGPVLHVREGDRVVFTMKNRSDEAVLVSEPGKGAAPFYRQMSDNPYQKPEAAISPMPHSMDFHSGTVAADDKWRSISPGETVQFEWVANYPGVYMYHCGTSSVLMHTAMGQYGAVVVSPKEGYPTEADHEYVITQSEFYLQQVGESYIYDHQAAMANNPSHVTFNGHVSALMDQPLRAKKGDRVRLYVLNAGPNGTSSFHVIGAIFDRVWYEGNLENEWRGMQTVLLGASNGAVMEFIVPEDGLYKLVDHEFHDAERGAAGALIAAPAQ
ncbi:nitrite reductase (NO-forming) [Marinimicrobium koreense]|uniref:Nitrite reductase (NO-forming) n=1 Tax=Marinimicrobium koreense TaxID=306545 RepID=A0A3N1NNE5_9GAMM|nr:multicopper oxidase domain-containing protein [Marinimicrobium koreense]ROQ21254.1 nitrite reductase (NO-forming) [Marinimicrobium koreense]